MAKGVDPKLVKAIIANLTKSGKGVADDVVKSGGNLVDEIKAAMAAVTGSAPKAPRLPKNPPKSKPLSQKELTTMKTDDKYLRSEGRRLAKEEIDNGINYMSDEEVAILELYKNSKAANKAPKNPPKSGRGEAGAKVKLTQEERDLIKQGANPKNPKAPPKDVGRAVNAEEEFVAGMQPTTAEVWKNGPALDKYASKNGPDTLDAEEYATLKLYNQFIKAGKTPPAPRLPKNPPKSGRGKNPPAAGAVIPAPKSPKPKSPKTGTADAAERAATKKAKSEANSAKWAEEREAYNAVKRAEREARKAKNKADWAKRLETEFDGNVVAARKATSKGANKNKKGKK